jgi:hypothetical protein
VPRAAVAMSFNPLGCAMRAWLLGHLLIFKNIVFASVIGKKGYLRAHLG